MDLANLVNYGKLPFINAVVRLWVQLFQLAIPFTSAYQPFAAVRARTQVISGSLEMHGHIAGRAYKLLPVCERRSVHILLLAHIASCAIDSLGKWHYTPVE